MSDLPPPRVARQPQPPNPEDAKTFGDGVEVRGMSELPALPSDGTESASASLNASDADPLRTLDRRSRVPGALGGVVAPPYGEPGPVRYLDTPLSPVLGDLGGHVVPSKRRTALDPEGDR